MFRTRFKTLEFWAAIRQNIMSKQKKLLQVDTTDISLAKEGSSIVKVLTIKT